MLPVPVIDKEHFLLDFVSFRVNLADCFILSVQRTNAILYGRNEKSLRRARRTKPFLPGFLSVRRQDK
jgi:hypothetical protein